jgi:hypothetical protein
MYKARETIQRERERVCVREQESKRERERERREREERETGNERDACKVGTMHHTIPNPTPSFHHQASFPAPLTLISLLP